MHRKKLKTRILATATALVVVSVLLCLWAARTIEAASRGRVHATASETPRTPVALVLGCSPTFSGGGANPFFEHRMAAAAELWRSGRCSILLVSGDNHVRTYDEPTAMRQRLIELGVSTNAIVLDYAGFSTFDSIIRARDVFGLSEFCVVSQADHAKRAIYLADHLGLKTVAFAARPVAFGDGLRTRVREALARVRAVLDVGLLQRRPHFLGPRIEILQTRVETGP